MASKFEGTIEGLKAEVESLGGTGSWDFDGSKHCFKCRSGAVINWWPSTRSIQLQGKPEARRRYASLIANGESAPSAEATASHDTEHPPASLGARVFVVHGHDDTAREQLELCLLKLGLRPFVLQNSSGKGLTIIEALEREIVENAPHFGIVLMTPDDMGYAHVKGPDSIAARARQNVVLEMGMLIARLGRGRVAILKKGHLEVPSDANGIIYIHFNVHVKETVHKLVQRLRDAGFDLDVDRISDAAG